MNLNTSRSNHDTPGSISPGGALGALHDWNALPLKQMAAGLSERLERLQNASLADSLDWNMTPQLAYGRHRGPARMNSRRAAVAVGMYFDPDCGWVFPLTRRPHALKHHGGQICFPGGRIEHDETPPEAALREFEEELGIPADVYRICGNLPTQYVYASDNEVTPVVCVMRKPEMPWKPDPGEVDEVILLPLAAVFEQARVQPIWHRRAVQAAADPAIEVAQFRFSAPAFVHQSLRIWGATAVILDQLAQCLLPHRPRLQERQSLPTWPDFQHQAAEASGVRTLRR
ncbi:NUDIX hydrolase [Aporhodopirellula aestuarii]|uniref:CoA pyrophosphatase n=1 Tax=Aporhodopirellula aestuarii TaxID=2950107 RepID=A0ABT0U363_9BACT|nr:CoA pyrophosphatase [Aporhodopirellula aestuarii]MCM2370928.1 CoA pyrophosphatase [Aporhodopirellula aestuarii]